MGFSNLDSKYRLQHFGFKILEHFFLDERENQTVNS